MVEIQFAATQMVEFNALRKIFLSITKGFLCSRTSIVLNSIYLITIFEVIASRFH